jgi:predicted protein tyrosine phosphatase
VRLVVCALADAPKMARRRTPNGIVSLLSEAQAIPRLLGEAPWLVLRFHDIDGPREGLTAPDAAIIANLLAFGAARGAEETVLVHCWMGISRSPAAAFILACAAAPTVPEDQIARALRRAAPAATPNPLMVSLADHQLGRQGRMIAAISAIGRGRENARGAPFDLDTAQLQSGPRSAP